MAWSSVRQGRLAREQSGVFRPVSATNTVGSAWALDEITTDRAAARALRIKTRVFMNDSFLSSGTRA
jgi:hypothetical protein